MADEEFRVKRWLFYHIFNTKFNIGFGSPATDVCSMCCRLKNDIKSATDPVVKNNTITEYPVHKLRAKVSIA